MDSKYIMSKLEEFFKPDPNETQQQQAVSYYIKFSYHLVYTSHINKSLNLEAVNALIYNSLMKNAETKEAKEFEIHLNYLIDLQDISIIFVNNIKNGIAYKKELLIILDEMIDLYGKLKLRFKELQSKE